MSFENYSQILSNIKPFTKYIYLHVLGEPMLHPDFMRFFKSALQEGFKVNLSTNASFLSKYREFLLENPANQINFSLHDAEENVPVHRWEDHLMEIFKFSIETAPTTYVSLRLWNRQSELSSEFNQSTLALLNSFYKTSFTDEIFASSGKYQLSRHVFLNVSSRFEWPDGESVKTGKALPCYALRDQIAILTDGTVVPCCIDADANLALGNIHQEELQDILVKDRTKTIKSGLSQGIFTEDFCKTCGFIIGKE